MLIPGKLFVGGVLEAESQELLRSHGITHVVSCLGVPDADEVARRKQAKLELPTFFVRAEDDAYYAILKHHASDVCSHLSSLPPNAVALIHCASGCNRSVSLGCAFAVETCPELAARAPACRLERLELLLDRLLPTRSPVLTNEGFVDQLLSFWPCCAVPPRSDLNPPPPPPPPPPPVATDAEAA